MIEDYGLVMPFVTVVSKGGPHDDDAYTAGWEMGSLDRLLSDTCCPDTVQMILRFDNRAQADLVAMHNGFTMSVDLTDDEHWDSVEFTRVNPQVGDAS